MESCPRRSDEPLASLAREAAQPGVTGTDGMLDRGQVPSWSSKPTTLFRGPCGGARDASLIPTKDLHLEGR